MKLFLTTLLSISVLISFGQSATLKGKIIDAETQEPLVGVKIILRQNYTIKGGALTDFDGEYVISNVVPGSYALEFSGSLGGFETQTDSVQFRPEETIVRNISLSRGQELHELEVVMVKSEKRTRSRLKDDRRRSDTREVISSEQINIDGAVQSLPNVSIQSKRIARKNAVTSYSTSNPNTADNARFAAIKDNTFLNVKKEPLSTFSIDVDKSAYTQTRRELQSGRLPNVDLVRIEEYINYFDYDYPQPTDETPFSVTTEYTNCPWNENHRIAMIGVQGEIKDLEDAQTNNLVFLIDISGSMRGSDRIELVKSGMKMLVNELRPEDNIAIVTYAGAAQLALKSTKGSKKEEILSVIDNLSAAGSTNGSGAIHLAYEIAEKNFQKNGNNRVILATDGDFNVGTTSQDELVKLIEEKRDNGVFLSILGVGAGNFQDAKMEQIADHGNGNYYYLDNLLEAKRTIVTGMTGLLYTIAKDVKIQVEFNPKHVQSYRLIGYANRMLAAEDFNDDTKDAGELGAGHTVTAIYEIVPNGIEDPMSSNIDPLKYQEVQARTNEGLEDELFTVKLRYKEPNGTTSKKIEKICSTTRTDLDNASENIRFASAVAEFGLLLRNSEFKSEANFNALLARAKKAKGDDTDGLRAEFIHLAESAELVFDQRSENK